MAEVPKAPKACDEDARAVFNQRCENARHYSNLRFAMFTMFTAILGGLFALELNGFYGAVEGVAVRVFRWLAVLLAVLFIMAEWRVGTLITFYQEFAANPDSTSLHLHLPEKHNFWKCAVRVVMCAPLALAILFWLWLLCTRGEAPMVKAGG